MWESYSLVGFKGPKGPQGQKRPADVVGNAVMVMRIATGEEEKGYEDDRKDPAAKALGASGGKARAGKLTPLSARLRSRGRRQPSGGQKSDLKNGPTPGMNKLSRETRSLILKMLCEGQCMRSTARLVDNTVAKLLVDASRARSRPGDSNWKLQHLRADPLDPLCRLQGGRPMTGPCVDFRSRTCMDVHWRYPQNPARLEPHRSHTGATVTNLARQSKEKARNYRKLRALFGCGGWI